jgi:predicted nucleic acid-binding Zn ribbon protein
MEQRTCLECEGQLRGRADKKFCSDECRTSYNNRQNSSRNNLMRNINYTLRKNRRILKAVNPSGKLNIHRSVLERKGFNFNYFTNIYTTKSGTTYYFCYDQGYIFHENDYLTLVVRQEYIE